MNIKPSAPTEQNMILGEQVAFDLVKIPQPDGSILVKPGKVKVLPSHIGSKEFSERTGISHRHLNRLCLEGLIACRRTSPKPRSKFLIPITELSRVMSLGKIDPKPKKT